MKQEECEETELFQIVESHARSWLKSIVWRIMGVFILGLLAWMVTKDWGTTTLITITFHLIRLVLYYFHERAWERVRWGRKLRRIDNDED